MGGTYSAGIRPAPAAACASAASKRSMCRKVASSEKAPAVRAAAPSALTRRRTIGSNVEEDGFVGSAEMDRQAPCSLVVPLGEQCRAPLRLDLLQHRIVRVRRVALEVEARRQTVEHTAGEDRDVDMRRLQTTLGPRHAARLDGAEMAAAIAIGRGAAEAVKIRIERQVAAILGMVVAAVTVGLPDLEHPVGHDGAIGIMQAEYEIDPLAHHIGRCKIVTIGLD